VWLALRATWELRVDAETRWFGTTPESNLCAVLLIGRMLSQIMVNMLKKGGLFDKKRVVYFYHHLIVIAVYWLGVTSGQSHFFGSAMALVESSNPCLGNMEVWRSCSKGWNERNIGLVAANSVLWLAVFVVFRLINVPCVLWMWGSDVFGRPEETWAKAGLFERYGSPLAQLAILSLSASWFPAALRGTIKKVKQFSSAGKQAKD